MKSLEIVKNIWCNGATDWVVDIKNRDPKKAIGSSFKRNVFARKVKAYLDGEAECIRHNGKEYFVVGSRFTKEGKKVFIITDEDEAPVAFYYIWHGKETVYDFAFVDEDMSFFTEYGYIVEDRR